MTAGLDSEGWTCRAVILLLVDRPDFFHEFGSSTAMSVTEPIKPLFFKEERRIDKFSLCTKSHLALE
jgi:hypothetical protein